MKRSALAILAAAVVVQVPVMPASAAITIQPGMYMVAGSAACTTNFVFDGTGSYVNRVFVGTAAHCVTSVGQDVSDGSTTWGDVAIIGNAGTYSTDWAYIEVRTAFRSSVIAAVKGNTAYPTGFTTPTETVIGDQVQISGYGLAYSFSNVTRERRVALMNSDTTIGHGIIGPIIHGDSGGPLVHIPSGKALGIVSRLCAGEGICTEAGPTVQGMLDAAAARTFTVNLRTV